MGDYSKASRELSYVNVTLKKELEEKSREASHFRKECASRQRKLDEYKSRTKMLEQVSEPGEYRRASEFYHFFFRFRAESSS